MLAQFWPSGRFAWRLWALYGSVAVAIIFLGHRAPRAQPQSPAELVARLQECGVNFYLLFVASNNPDPEAGLFLCTQERSWDDMPWPRLGKYGDRWAGVVHVQRCPNEETLAMLLADWGHFGAVFGGVVVFGDPQIIGRIESALRP
jgi:hypothetical protein